ncbi:hypothetical protein KJ940_16975, partial [Myxococcota bacterium]|nr:hypothetical protein [Myxococcota bacterium]
PRPAQPSQPPRRIAHPPRDRASLNRVVPAPSEATTQAAPSVVAAPVAAAPPAPSATKAASHAGWISIIVVLSLIGVGAFFWLTRPRSQESAPPPDEEPPTVFSLGHERLPTHRTLFESEPSGASVMVWVQRSSGPPQRHWIASTPGTLDIVEGSEVKATFHLRNREDTTIEWRVDREALIHAVLERDHSEIRRAQTSPAPRRARRKADPNAAERARAEIDYLRGIDAMKRGAPKTASRFFKRALSKGLEPSKAAMARRYLDEMVTPSLDDRLF